MYTSRDTVLIVTTSYDEAPAYVSPHIGKRGLRHFRLNTDQFPMEVQLTLREDGSFSLATSDGQVESSEIRSVWYRRHVDPEFPPEVEQQFSDFGAREARAHLTGALLGLEDVLWVSHPASLWAGEKKPFQMRVASSLGFRMPETRVTNDPSTAEKFGQSRQLIAKAVSSGYIRSERGFDAIFTSPVTGEDLRDLDGLALSPVTFQELIPKRSDIRVTVVGEHVFAAEILSQAHESSRIDWRAIDSPALEHRPYEMPAVAAERCRLLLDALALRFGAIDFVLDRSGQLVFLEINPNGEWMWIEDLVGHPVSNALAEQLSR